MIQIDEKRYAELLRAEYQLECLEAWGVDNWIEYDNALNESIDDMPSAREFCSWSDEKVNRYWEERD